MENVRTVQEIMTPGRTSIASDAMAVEAARRMLSEDVGSLPVVDGATLVGMITDRDLVLQVVAKDLEPSQGSRLRRLQAGSGDRRGGRVAPRRPPAHGQRAVRRLPVLSGGRLVGIIAQADVARKASAESTGRLVEEFSE